MTLKEQLHEKYKEHEKTLDISGKIKEITELMNQNYLCGQFIITIYRIQQPQWIGNINPSRYIDIMPDGISDEEYLELYRKEIEKMGFGKEDYSFCTSIINVGTRYEFVLMW